MSESSVIRQARNNAAADLQEIEEVERNRALRDIALLIERFNISASEIDPMLPYKSFRQSQEHVYKLFDPIFGD